MRKYLVSIIFIVVAVSLATYGLNLTGYLSLPQVKQNKATLHDTTTTTIIKKVEQNPNATSVTTTTRQTTITSLTTTLPFTSTTVTQSSKIKINEIMYNPSGSDTKNEWIEIFNDGTNSVNLTNWKLYEGETNHKFSLKQGNMILNVGGYAVIVQNFTGFLSKYPNYSGTLIETTFSLGNTGETIALKDDSLNIADEITYESSLGAYDNGRTLERKDGEWKESMVNGGTPGSLNSIFFTNTTSTIATTTTTSQINSTSTTTITIPTTSTTIASTTTSTTLIPTTSSTTTTTSLSEETTTTTLTHEIYIGLVTAKDPIVRGNNQTLMAEVVDDDGPIGNAFVNITVFYFNSSTIKYFSGYTDSGGLYSVSWQIGGNSKNGTFQITATAFKEGYGTAETHETFEVISA
jgi:hypothetical protein